MGAPEGCKQHGRICMGSSLEMIWLALGGPFLSFLAYMELATSDLTLQGLHFQRSRPIFQLRQVGISRET